MYINSQQSVPKPTFAHVASFSLGGLLTSSSLLLLVCFSETYYLSVHLDVSQLPVLADYRL